MVFYVRNHPFLYYDAFTGMLSECAGLLIDLMIFLVICEERISAKVCDQKQSWTEDYTSARGMKTSARTQQQLKKSDRELDERS